MNYKIVPSITKMSGETIYTLYVEIEVTKGMLWWKKKVKIWNRINDFAYESRAKEVIQHLNRPVQYISKDKDVTIKAS
jgi:hypothetical protein